MPAPSFASLLDQALGRAGDVPPTAMPRTWARWPEPQAPSPFLFARPLTNAVPRWTVADSAPRVAPAHRLTPEQQAAFDQLLTLGADLPAGFTAKELLREYRRLARRFHPDRHRSGDTLALQQLARSFAAASAAYRCLRVVVDVRH